MRKRIIILALLFFSAFSTAYAETTITLLDPVYGACGAVEINGVVMSDGDIFDLVWDWGDGTVSNSFFEAHHRYLLNGPFTVSVTAAGCFPKTATTTVEVTNAEDAGCPPIAGPSCLYLYPYNLHLTEGVTSASPLEIRDHSGAPVEGDITFEPSEPSLISVSAEGYVTALREESSSEGGAWIQAIIHEGSNERWTANTCVARVLSSDYGISFNEAVTENTVLYYPASINGEDIEALVNQYEIPTVNEYAYSVQSNLMGLKPFGGCRQIYEIDFGESETQRVCGISGNPIRLGWNILGNEWQNCFLVPFTPPRSPQWFIFYHEMGHNFTWSSGTFGHGLGNFYYSEGLASAIGLASMEAILHDPLKFPIGTAAHDTLQDVYDNHTQGYLNARNNWLNSGADFASLDPDIVDGIWLYHAASRGIGDFALRFFLPLAPKYIAELGPMLCEIKQSGEDGQHTFFVALVSAAAGEDLSDVFNNLYHYPVLQPLFSQAFDACLGIIASSACPGDLDHDGDVDGRDLAILATPPLNESIVCDFAKGFGRTDCFE